MSDFLLWNLSEFNFVFLNAFGLILHRLLWIFLQKFGVTAPVCHRIVVRDLKLGNSCCRRLNFCKFFYNILMPQIKPKDWNKKYWQAPDNLWYKKLKKTGKFKPKISVKVTENLSLYLLIVLLKLSKQKFKPISLRSDYKIDIKSISIKIRGRSLGICVKRFV